MQVKPSGKMSGIVTWRTVGGIVAVVLLSGGPPLAERVLSAGNVSGSDTATRPVVDRNVREAVATLRARFRLDTPQGLSALRDLSLGVLRDGLKDEDPYERCYAASALAEQGDWSGVGIIETGVASSDPGLRRATIEVHQSRQAQAAGCRAACLARGFRPDR